MGGEARFGALSDAICVAVNNSPSSSAKNQGIKMDRRKLFTARTAIEILPARLGPQRDAADLRLVGQITVSCAVATAIYGQTSPTGMGATSLPFSNNPKVAGNHEQVKTIIVTSMALKPTTEHIARLRDAVPFCPAHARAIVGEPRLLSPQ